MATPVPAQPLNVQMLNQVRSVNDFTLGLSSLEVVLALDAFAEILELRYTWFGVPKPAWMARQRALIADAIVAKRALAAGRADGTHTPTGL